MPGGKARPSSAAAKRPANPGAARGADGGYVQPTRPIPAAHHGDRQASVDLQASAPMAVAAGGAPVEMAPAAEPMPAGMPAPDPFGPSRRPDEPLTAGAALGPGNSPRPQDTVRAVLGALYEEFGLDELLDLIEEIDED
jgi:hypothetical protein